jgi:caffeoyl-CoA O-methyltransferase
MNLEQLTAYCEGLCIPESSILKELERETNLKTLKPRMISGHLQGTLLHMLVKIHGSKRILEIGTFTGYATICMASALPEDGELITLEANEELEFISGKYFKKANLDHKIKQHFGDAKSLVKSLSGNFDLVFIDAGKKDNEYYYETIFPQVKTGGLILVDNVLWSGKVLDQKMDKHTKIIHDFNVKMSKDERIETLYLPLRDGLALFRKK